MVSRLLGVALVVAVTVLPGRAGATACAVDADCTAVDVPPGVHTFCFGGTCSFRLADGSEPLVNLRRLFVGLAVYHGQSDRRDASGALLGCVYPVPPVGTTYAQPSEAKCCDSLGGPDANGDNRCDPSPNAWLDWADLGFAVETDFAYVYTLAAIPGGVRMTLASDDAGCTGCQHELTLDALESASNPCALEVPASVSYSFCADGVPGAAIGAIALTSGQQAGFVHAAGKQAMNSRYAEAATNLDSIIAKSVAFYEVNCAWPADRGVTPLEDSCCHELGGHDDDLDDLCDADPGAWVLPAWTSIGFAVSGSHAFTYEMKQGGPGFQAAAHDDLDCDGYQSTFARFARVVSSQPPCQAEALGGQFTQGDGDGCPDLDCSVHGICKLASSAASATTPVAADGASPSLLVFTLLDRAGRRMAGHAVHLATNLGQLSVPGQKPRQDLYATTNAQGQAIAYLTSTDPGTATVTASAITSLFPSLNDCTWSLPVVFAPYVPAPALDATSDAGKTYRVAAGAVQDAPAGTTASLSDVGWIDPATLPQAGLPGEGNVLNLGVLTFTAAVKDSLNQPVVGKAVRFDVTFPSPVPAGATVFKFGPTPEEPTPHWYELPSALVLGNDGDAVLTLVVTDGGLGDSDLSANGIITDPILVYAPASSVPTLGEWGILTALLLLLAVAVRRLRPTGAQPV